MTKVTRVTKVRIFWKLQIFVATLITLDHVSL